MLSDIAIAQAARMQPITEIAAKVGLTQDDIIPYGKYKAKLSDELMERLCELPRDRLIVLYCYHGANSMLAARKLAALGYEVADVYGGILAYTGNHLATQFCVDNDSGEI